MTQLYLVYVYLLNNEGNLHDLLIFFYHTMYNIRCMAMTLIKSLSGAKRINLSHTSLLTAALGVFVRGPQRRPRIFGG